MKNRIVTVNLLVICLLVETRAEEPIDFNRDVRPILSNHCFKCHGRDKKERQGGTDGLRLDTKEGAVADLGGYAAIVRGKPEASELVLRIRSKDPDERMPPADSGKKLTPEEITRLVEWVKQGAPYAQHWSFVKPIRPQLPTLQVDPRSPLVSWPRNEVDQFILARLLREGLKPAPEAKRYVLIRRVSLNLTGQPPTPEEVRAFVDDPAELDVAYARVVDRLLHSARYGERWAQHWLDVIRWAETVGFETNLERPGAWHYRDWVIDSLNDDKPYDRFILEQIAGDTVGADAALGFLVAGPANLPGQIGRDEEAMRQARQDELDEVIRTVSQSLFGLTIGCARCHDHKFDPIRQRDYYAMQAVFAGLTYGHRRLRGPQNDEWSARAPKVRDELRGLREKREARQRQFRLRSALKTFQTESFNPVRVDAVRMEIAATNGGPASLYEFEVWSSAKARNVALASAGAKPSASSFALANQTRHFDNLVDGSVDKRQAFPWVAAAPGSAWLQVDLRQPATIDRVRWYAGSSTPASYEIKVRDTKSSQWRTVAHTRDRLPRVDDMRAAKNVRLEGLSSGQVDSLFRLLAEIRGAERELARLSNGPQAYAARFSANPETTWLLKRGQPRQRTAVVAPAVPGFLLNGDSPLRPRREIDRRLGLARHLTRPDHPLTARVMVNRVWQHHFGVGLVETPSDFGLMGASPSHSKLLDWLAVEFVERGYSLKKLHRLIVQSRTYRQSSRPRSEAMAIDAESRLLWRYPPRRLDAEAIRDSILTLSGKLSTKMNGRGFDFFDRRGGLSDYTAKKTFDENGWRRMIYAHKIRMESVDIFGAFDCPDAGQMAPRRSQSITPIQSLGLFNSPFVNRQADFFAERVRKKASDDLRRCVDRAFEVALARQPSDIERDRMVELAKAHGLEQVCRVILNSTEFLYVN